ncbi:MAG TPA: hypothetical protein VHG69_12760 [Thermoleophilaceae bacterium]|nr:hypothetical protein [Thermoleophilaceae bacterium]
MTTKSRTFIAVVLVVLVASAAIAIAPAGSTTSRLPQGSERVDLDPADFTTRITNPWWPMRPGARWVYRETDSKGTRQRVVVTVTNRTKKIANGVTARVVRDVVTEGRQLVEVTDDWYAQDKPGNIWYLGELTKEHENGRFKSTEGSFEAGVDGAQAGVIMPARPRPGLRYRQEHYRGHAEDKAKVLSLREQAEVPFGHFRPALMTRDVNPLTPKVLEFKFYARGVGPVLAISVSGGSDREELVSYRKGR